jgi:hypothetical protein
MLTNNGAVIRKKKLPHHIGSHRGELEAWALDFPAGLRYR